MNDKNVSILLVLKYSNAHPIDFRIFIYVFFAGSNLTGETPPPARASRLAMTDPPGGDFGSDDQMGFDQSNPSKVI
jgi:hypothetical protein